MEGSTASLPRELVRWLQTLDLPQQIRHPKRDLANGYLAAEICARYWPNVDLRQFDNGTSTKVKQSNWVALRKAMSKNNASLPDSLVNDVIRATDDAGRQLLEALYTMFTNRVVQKSSPIDVPELPQVPTYVKAQRISDQQQAQQLMQAQHQQQQLMQMEEEAQMHAAQEREAQEAEKKRQQQKATAAASAKKPKPPMKVQGIRAMTEEEETEGQPKLQFSTVTVKPLSGQALARLGVARVSSASRRQPAAAAGGDAPNRVSAGDGVLTTLSSTIESTLRDSSAPSWLVPPGTTYVEYFAQQHSRLPGAIKDAIWSALYANIEETAKWLINRPADIAAFAAAFVPGVNTVAVQTLLGRAHYAFTGLDSANAAAYAKSVFANVAQRRHGYALSALQRSVLPLVVASYTTPRSSHLARLPPSAATDEDLNACTDVLAALAGCNVDSWTIAEVRVRQLLTALHEAIVTPSAAPSSSAVGKATHEDAAAASAAASAGPTERYIAFLLAVDAVCALPCASQGSGPAEGRVGGSSDNALDSPSRDALGGGVSVRSGTDEEGQTVTLPARLHNGVATAALYHATAALHHESASVRVVGLRLLSRLASSGHVDKVLPKFMARLTDLTQPVATTPLNAEHREFKVQSLHLLRSCAVAISALRVVAQQSEQGPHQLSDDELQVLGYADALDTIVLHVSHGADQQVSFFASLSFTEKLYFVSEIGATSAASPSVPSADGQPTVQQLAVRNLVTALLQLPKKAQLALTGPATKSSSLGLATSPMQYCSAPSLAGSSAAWPVLPIVSMLVQILAAAPIVVPTVPLPKGVKPSTKASQQPAGVPDAAALGEALHFVTLLHHLTALHPGPLCAPALIPLGWEVMKLVGPELSKAIKYVDQYTALKARVGPAQMPAPADVPAHETTIRYGRRARAIVARFFAEWSGAPSAAQLAQSTVDQLANPRAFEDVEDKDFDEGREGWDRVLEWWNAVVLQQ